MKAFRGSWTKDSSTWAIIARVISIITQSYSISPHMLTRVANSDRYPIYINSINTSTFAIIESIGRTFLVTSKFTTHLVPLAEKSCRIKTSWITWRPTHSNTICCDSSPSSGTSISSASIKTNNIHPTIVFLIAMSKEKMISFDEVIARLILNTGVLFIDVTTRSFRLINISCRCYLQQLL